jgi:heat shock protein HslJ
MKKIALVVALLAVVMMAGCITVNQPTVTQTTTVTPPPTVTVTPPPVTVTPPPTTTPPATTSPPLTVIPTVTMPPVTLLPLIVPFENKTWHLEAYGSGSLTPAIPGKDVTLRFESATGKISGNAGCNSYGGSYVKIGGELGIAGVMSTMMYCPMPSGLMTQESYFLNALKGAEKYTSITNQLTILCSDSRVLVFHP